MRSGKCVLLLIALFFTAVLCRAEVFPVFPSDDIASCVNDAAEGDSILLYPGTYRAHLLLVDKGLTIGGLDLLAPEHPPYNFTESTIWIGEDSLGVPTRCITWTNEMPHNIRLVGITFRSSWVTDSLSGGLLSIHNAIVELRGCNLLSGHAAIGGGAAFDSCSGTIRDCQMIANFGSLGGAGIDINGGIWTLENNLFRGNHANSLEGGGLRVVFADGVAEQNRFIFNSAGTYGGGFCVHGTGHTWNIIGNEFIHNLAGDGSGLEVGYLDSVLIDSNLFLENGAPSLSVFGGALQLVEFGHSFQVCNNDFIRNVAGYGAAVYANGNGVFEDNLVLMNQAFNAPGLVLNSSNGIPSSMLVRGNIIEENIFIDPRAADAYATVHVMVQTTATLRQNDLLDNSDFVVGMQPGHESTADAAENYWGSPDGPRQDDQNPDGSGGRVTPTVNILPFSVDPINTLPPPVAVFPDSVVDLGAVHIDSSLLVQFPIGNEGRYWLTIDPAMTDTTDFSIVSPPPWRIAPLDTIDIQLQFHPRTGGRRETILILETNDPTAPEYTLILQGTGYPFENVDSGATALPAHFTLDGVYPNPFNDSASVLITLPQPGEVQCELVDILGRIVWSVSDVHMSNGQHRLSIDGSRLPSGSYYLHVKFNDDQTIVEKAICVK